MLSVRTKKERQNFVDIENTADEKEAEALKKQIKLCKDYKSRLRLNVLYCYYKGESMDKLADRFCLSIATVWEYIKGYKDNRKDSDLPRGGKKEKITSKESAELEAHLENKTYLKIEEIIKYVAKRYKVLYSKSGMGEWLKRHGFSYKKPKVTPAKLDPIKQEEFIEQYLTMRAEQDPDEVIIFIDGVHPAHQTQDVYGWIRKGMELAIKTTAKQPRTHFMGALDIDNPDKPFTVEYDTINAEAVVDFLNKVKDRYIDKKKVTIISDNAGYHKGLKIKKFLEDNRQVKIIYLPSYSPNLNPIERLWKIMRESVVYNKYYDSFKDFKLAVKDFFENRIKSLGHVLRRRINDNFQVIIPKFIRL